MLAFNYITKQNDIEPRRIESTMTMQNFVGLPLEYRRQKSNLNYLALFYAMAHWQQVAQCLAMMCGTMALLRDDDPEAYQPMAERFEREEARLMSLEQVFDEACKAHGLDHDVMRFMAGSRFYEIATPGLTPDEDYQSKMREIFARILAD